MQTAKKQELKEQLLNLIHEQSPGRDENYKGSILFSGFHTLIAAPLYLMGYNPGGAPSGTDRTLVATVNDVFKQPEEFSSYTDEIWGHGGTAGTSRHQQNVQALVSGAGFNVKQVFSANAIFSNSKSVSSLGGSERLHAEASWKVHQFFLSIVRPRIVICLGNGEAGSSYSILKNKTAGANFRLAPRQGKRIYDWEQFEAKFDLGKYSAPLDTLIVGVPHPSYPCNYKPAIIQICTELRRRRPVVKAA